MSIAALSAVWEHSTQKGGALLVMLALADYAHKDGSNAYPTVETLAGKARMSERNARYILRELEDAGEIIAEGKHPSGTTIYRIKLPIPQGAIFAPAEIAGGNMAQEGGAKQRMLGGQWVAPKPSVTVKEPLDIPTLSATTKKAPPNRKTTLPENWQPDDGFYLWAETKHFTDADIESELEQFKNSALAHRRMYADWTAAFRNWMTSDFRKRPTYTPRKVGNDWNMPGYDADGRPKLVL